MGELENTLLFTPKFLVERGYEKCPKKDAFRPGILPGRRVNGYKADSSRYFAGIFRPCKRGPTGAINDPKPRQRKLIEKENDHTILKAV
ncbi:hypothetical protein TNCV_1483271 [Trichonephila clavipes]|nr:hypothetical protein TNCV_1483271 [Trichonephila clavipes]